MAIKNITNNMNQGQSQQMNPLAPAPLVQQAAQQSFAMKNGGQLPQVPMQGAPSGGIAPVAPTPVNYFQSGGGINGKFDLTPDTPAPAPEYGAEGVKVTESPADVKQNDLSSLSAALSNVGGQQQPQFTSDPNQRDGGFFGWLKGLAPKLRPGRREGETDDEYDRRITTNRENMAVLADAMRHMGNIINTSKYAPAQQFNDPTTAMEQGYQQRRAQRQKKAALDADQAYKQANLSLKEKAAEADRAYKELSLGLKQQAEKRASEKDAFDRDFKQKGFQRQLDNDKFNQDMAQKKFEYQQIRDKVKDGQWRAGYGIKVANLNLSRARFAHTLAKDAKGGGSGGSGYTYATPYGSLYSKKQLSPQQEKQMWNFMVINKQITPQKMKEYQLAAKGDGANIGIFGTNNGSPSKAREIMQKAIAYGLMDATGRGDAFRKFCTTQLGMGEDRIFDTPQNATTWNKGKGKKGQTGKFSIK